MDFSQQMTIIRESIWTHSIRRDSKVKFISPEKWRSMMRKVLEKFKSKGIYDTNMIDDLATILGKISEDCFVEATLNLQPFKPMFSQKKIHRHHSKCKTSQEELSEEQETHFTRTKLQQSPKQFKNSIIKFKHTVHEKIADWDSKSDQCRKSMLEEMLTLAMEQKTLVHEFEGKHHPFKKIIEQFLFLLESKYKLVINSKSQVEIQQLQEKLIIDLRLLQQFIVKSSEPYIDLFKTDDLEEKETFRLKLIAFIRQYIERNDKINQSIRRIMRAACRKTAIITKLNNCLPNFPIIEQFQIPPEYRIDGCYAHSMTTLIELCECTSSIGCLKKLKELRFSLGKDLDLFYNQSENEGTNQLELTADVQLEIVKFLVAKVKAFVNELYAQLKYLQVVCGEQDMSYKFDDSSYMYAQLSVALEALQLDHA